MKWSWVSWVVVVVNVVVMGWAWVEPISYSAPYMVVNNLIVGLLLVNAVWFGGTMISMVKLLRVHEVGAGLKMGGLGMLLVVASVYLLMVVLPTEQVSNMAPFYPPPCPTPDCSCGPGCVIEEHGKIAVARLEHTVELVRAYGAENVRISALGYQYIEDEAYVKRLLGDEFGEVHCIIPVEWPDGRLVYIETMVDGEEVYTPLTGEAFDALISDVSEEDKAILVEYMNDDQTHVRRFTDLY